LFALSVAGKGAAGQGIDAREPIGGGPPTSPPLSSSLFNKNI